MSSDIIDDASRINKQSAVVSRSSRRRGYDYALDGVAADDELGGYSESQSAGDRATACPSKPHSSHAVSRDDTYSPICIVANGNVTSDQDTPHPAFANLTDNLDLLAETIGSVRSHDQPIDNESDNPKFVLLSPDVCALAGGGVAALVLQSLVYWVSPAAHGLPRARPQRDIDHPAWPTPGLAKIAQLIGLDTSVEHRAAEKKVGRAVRKLLRKAVIDTVESGPDDQAIPRDGRSWRRLELRLTAATSGQLQDAGLLQPADQHGESAGAIVKVWTVDVRQLGVNEAIVLGQLWYRCVLAKRTFRVKRLDGDWFPCSYTKLAMQTGLSEDQVREALWARKQRKDGKCHGLVRQGLVTVRHERFRGSETMHFQIMPAARKVIERMRAERQ